MRALFAGAFAALALLVGDVARAQPADAAAAEALFLEGRTLMKAERYEEACKKFELSARLERAPGTEANLAECYVKLGRTASAWLHYREAAALSQQAGEAARATEARDRAAKIEPSLCRLVLRAPPGFPPNAKVLRDGQPVDPVVFGTGVPVDPGEHVIDAIEPTLAPVRASVTIAAPAEGAACADTAIDLPALPYIAPPPPPLPLVPRPVERVEPSPRRTIGFVVGGVGVVAAAVGAGFAIDAIGKKNGAACTDTSCTSDGLDQRRAAGTSADVATVALIAGGVLAATGLVLLITAPTIKHEVARRPLEWRF